MKAADVIVTFVMQRPEGVFGFETKSHDLHRLDKVSAKKY